MSEKKQTGLEVVFGRREELVAEALAAVIDGVFNENPKALEHAKDLDKKLARRGSLSAVPNDTAD